MRRLKSPMSAEYRPQRADVVLHAIPNALLGDAVLGD